MSKRFALLLLVSVVSASVLVTAAETKIDGPVIGIDLGILMDLSVHCALYIQNKYVCIIITLLCIASSCCCVGSETCSFFMFFIFDISCFPFMKSL